MPAFEPLTLAAIRARVDEAASRATADGIAIAWLEVRREAICEGGRPRSLAAPHERTVVVRVREGGRVGESRTGSGGSTDLEAAVRAAVAASRVAARPDTGEAPGGMGPEEPLPMLFDPAVASLEVESVRTRLAGMVARREVAEVDWAVGRLVVGGNLATPRTAELTAISLAVRCGRRPGAGSAEGAARSLAALPFEAIVERARAAHGGTGLGELPDAPVAAVFAATAAVELFESLAALSRTQGGESELGSALTALGLELVDEPRGEGLPLPWDLLGRLRERVAWPAGEAREGADPPWIGRNWGLRGGLVKPEEQWLVESAGGLWVGAVSGVERVPARGGTLLRWTGRGLRRIDASGQLGDPVPDAQFEVGFDSLLGAIRGCSPLSTCRASSDRLWGGFSAPSIAVGSLPVGRPLAI